MRRIRSLPDGSYLAVDPPEGRVNSSRDARDTTGRFLTTTFQSKSLVNSLTNSTRRIQMPPLPFQQIKKSQPRSELWPWLFNLSDDYWPKSSSSKRAKSAACSDLAKDRNRASS